MIELVVVMSIIGIFAAVGIPLFNRASKNATIEGAKQVLLSMKKDCERNYMYNNSSDFSQLRINNYTILPSSGDCNLIGAVANDNKNFPSFSYNMNDGTFSCFYKDSGATAFPACKKVAGKNTSQEEIFLGGSNKEEESTKTEFSKGPVCLEKFGNAPWHCRCEVGYQYVRRGNDIDLNCVNAKGEKSNWEGTSTINGVVGRSFRFGGYNDLNLNSSGREQYSYSQKNWDDLEEWVEQGGDIGEFHSNPKN